MADEEGWRVLLNTAVGPIPTLIQCSTCLLVLLGFSSSHFFIFIFFAFFRTEAQRTKVHLRELVRSKRSYAEDTGTLSNTVFVTHVALLKGPVASRQHHGLRLS